MRRLTRHLSIIAIAVALTLTSGCGREKIKLEPTDESAPVIASTVNAADPNSSVQLVKGFHKVEYNSWRWTMGKFVVTLQPPPDGKQRGADLVLKFTIPESVINQVKSTTISMLVQNTPIVKQTYNAAGAYTLRGRSQQLFWGKKRSTLSVSWTHILRPALWMRANSASFSFPPGFEAK